MAGEDGDYGEPTGLDADIILVDEVSMMDIGVLKFNIIFSAIMMAVMAAASVLRIVDGLSPWMWVSGIFVFAYQLVNNLILYKVKTNASED